MPIDQTLLEKIRTNDPTMTSLDLTKDQIDDADAAALAEALTHNTILTHLRLAGNQIGDAGATALAEALTHNTTLTHLNLVENLIGSDSGTILAEAIKTNRTLTHLNLASNKIGADGAMVLAEALKTNRTLTHLNLARNQIGADGARVLAQALKTNRTLMHLNLAGNQIGADGAKDFAEALTHNTALMHLNLEANQFGDAGAMEFAEVLKNNTTLVHLLLSGNRIGPTGVKDLVEALKINATLIELTLTLGQITYELLGQAEIFLARNIKMLVIKAAWVHPVVGYSPEKRHGYLEEIKQPFGESVDEEVNAVIMAILALRFCSSEDDARLAEDMFEKLNVFLESIGIDFESLPDTVYPKELRRLLAGKVNAKNVLDPEAQVNALICLAQPFVDKGLQAQAIPELIGLLNNDFFGQLEIDPTQRRVVDALMFLLSCEFPHERDLMRFALAASARLAAKSENLTVAEINAKMEDTEAVIAEFKKELSGEYKGAEYSPAVMIEKCLEEIKGAFSPANTVSDRCSPNVKKGLIIGAMVLSVAAIAAVTVLTCGVAGILGAAVAALASAITFGASLSTVGAIAGGVGLFGGAALVAGSVALYRDSRARKAIEPSVSGSDESSQEKQESISKQIKSLPVVRQVQYLITGHCQQKNYRYQYQESLKDRFIHLKLHFQIWVSSVRSGLGDERKSSYMKSGSSWNSLPT